MLLILAADGILPHECEQHLCDTSFEEIFVYNAVVTYEKSFLLYDNGIERNQKQFFSLQSLLADLLHSFALCSSAFKIFKALLHLLIVLFYCVLCAPICEDEKIEIPLCCQQLSLQLSSVT